MHTRPYVKVTADKQARERSTCGFRQRLFKKEDGAPVSITRLQIDNAQAHWYRHTDEYCYVLSGEGILIVDAQEVPVQAGDCVWIRRGHVHRAVGGFEALIICIPPLDHDDVLVDTPPEISE